MTRFLCGTFFGRKISHICLEARIISQKNAPFITDFQSILFKSIAILFAKVFLITFSRQPLLYTIFFVYNRGWRKKVTNKNLLDLAQNATDLNSIGRLDFRSK